MNGITITGRLERPVATNRQPQKSILPPSESPAPASSPPTLPGVSRAARMLALAYHVERLIEDGRLRDYAHAAQLLGITRARMTQVMNLLFLPVSDQEAVLLGRSTTTERQLRRARVATDAS